MVEATGEVPLVVIEKDIALRRLRFKVKSLLLNKENSEIRLLELDRDKERVKAGINVLDMEIKKTEEEIKKIGRAHV